MTPARCRENISGGARAVFLSTRGHTGVRYVLYDPYVSQRRWLCHTHVIAFCWLTSDVEVCDTVPASTCHAYRLLGAETGCREGPEDRMMRACFEKKTHKKRHANTSGGRDRQDSKHIQ